MLTGVNLGSYGKDTGSSLEKLLISIGDIPGLPRLRLSSLEPQFLTPELITLIDCLPICHHLHLSIQSGDKEILKAMNRDYDVDALRHRLEQMAGLYPDFNFGADIIVGFPGEDGSAFQNTYDFIAGTPISHLHVFPYSARPGTQASRVVDSVLPREKRERVAVLRKLSQEKFYDFRKRFDGQDFLATVEQGRASFIGLTDNYIRTSLACRPARNCVRVRIVKVNKLETLAEMI